MCNLTSFIAVFIVISTYALLIVFKLYFNLAIDFTLRISVPNFTDAVWTPVSGANDEYMVYSAYIESRISGSAKIRLIGTSHRDKTDQVFCKLWFDDQGNESYELVKATKQMIRENWYREYSACFFFCPLKNLSTVPTSVSLCTSQTQNISAVDVKIKVQNRFENERVEQPKKLAACTQPLYNISNVWTLIEWVEVNRILGFDHFHFYLYSCTDAVRCILEKYAEQGLVTILDWHTNTQKKLQLDHHELKIRIMNQLAAQNECLYRGMYKYRYLAFFDVDELLVPQDNATLLELVKKLEARHRKSASFIFRNSFYFTHWPDDPEYKGPNDLITQRKTKHKLEFEAMHVRSKYVLRAIATEEVGIHNLYQVAENFQMETGVDEKEASSRHYRFCDFGPEFCNAATVQDRRMWLLQRQLIERMDEVQKTFGAECRLNRTV